MARPCFRSGQGQGGLGGFLPGGRKPKKVCEMDLLQVPHVTLAPLGPLPNPSSTPVFSCSLAASRWPWPPPLRESVNSDAKIKAPSSLLGSHGNLDLPPQLQSHEAGAKRGQQGAPPPPTPVGAAVPPLTCMSACSSSLPPVGRADMGAGWGHQAVQPASLCQNQGGPSSPWALSPLAPSTPGDFSPAWLRLATPHLHPTYLLTHFREPQQQWGGQLLALSCRRPPFGLGFGGLSPR